MISIKKYLLFALSSLGLGSAGIYFLCTNHGPQHQENEKIKTLPSENVSSDGVIVANVEPNILSENANDSQPQGQITEDDDSSSVPISKRFWAEGRKRTISLDEARERVDILRDYTLRVGGATGWFLDYVLPESPATYPTKWFIATNAHVAEVIYFDQNNPYRQLLPQGKDSPNKYHVILVKERVEHEDRDFNQNLWDENYRGRLNKISYSWNVEKKKNRDDHSRYSQLYFQDKNPKLVYFPHQYLGEDNSKWQSDKFKGTNYSSDFAVMEIDFKEEWIARFMTRNFYNKYDAVVGTHKDKALNFFARPIAEKYTNKQVYEKDMQIFTAGYPASGIRYKSSSNYDSSTQQAGRLAYSIKYWHYPWNMHVPTEDGDYLLGHLNMSKWNLYYDKTFPGAMLRWNNQTFLERGYYYVVEDHWKGEVGGASGSLNITEDRDVLGLVSRAGAQRDGSFKMIAPLRNKEIRGADGRVLFPAYDLLEGVEGQKNSYRDQIMEYFLKNGKRTALSRLRNWSV